MTYSRPYNFAVSYHNYFTISYANVVFSYTIKVGTLCVKDQQVLRLEHKLRLMETLKKTKKKYLFKKKEKKKSFFCEKNIYSRPFNGVTVSIERPLNV